MADNLERHLVLSALRMALLSRAPPNLSTGSDQGHVNTLRSRLAMTSPLRVDPIGGVSTGSVKVNGKLPEKVQLPSIPVSARRGAPAPR